MWPKKFASCSLTTTRVLRRVVSGRYSALRFRLAPRSVGRGGRKILRESDFDVVLLTISMPGLSGLDALREIRRVEDRPRSSCSPPTPRRHRHRGHAPRRLRLPDEALDARRDRDGRAQGEEKRPTRPADASRATPSGARPRRRPKLRAALSTAAAPSNNSSALAETAARSDSTVITASRARARLIARFIHARSGAASSR